MISGEKRVLVRGRLYTVIRVCAIYKLVAREEFFLFRAKTPGTVKWNFSVRGTIM